MAVYLCNHPEGDIGSVRSARTDFLGFVDWLDAVYAHWGGEQAALEALEGGILDNINALIYDGTVFSRKDGVPAPHDGFTTVERLLEQAEKLDYADTTDPISFFPQRSARSARTLASSVAYVTISYPSGITTSWRYDEDTNLWDRDRNGTPEIDASSGAQIRAGTLIVLETDATPVRGEYLDVQTVGEGSALVFLDGIRRSVTWRRIADTAPLELVDDEDLPVGIAPGPVWIIVAVPGMTIE